MITDEEIIKMLKPAVVATQKGFDTLVEVCNGDPERIGHWIRYIFADVYAVRENKAAMILFSAYCEKKNCDAKQIIRFLWLKRVIKNYDGNREKIVNHIDKAYNVSQNNFDTCKTREEQRDWLLENLPALLEEYKKQKPGQETAINSKLQ